MNNINWIFFDIGSTLVDESVAYQNRIEKTIAGSQISYEEFVDRLIESYRVNTQGDTEIAADFKNICASFSLPPAIWDSNDETVYPEAEEVLRELSKRYHIGVIANQKLGSEKRLENIGLLRYIDLVIASAEEGVSKPALRIFQIALDRADCKPDETVMVGDRLDNDIIPANKIGMTTVWIKQGFGKYAVPSSMEEFPDFTVYSLKELINIFEIKSE